MDRAQQFVQGGLSLVLRAGLLLVLSAAGLPVIYAINRYWERGIRPLYRDIAQVTGAPKTPMWSLLGLPSSSALSG